MAKLEKGITLYTLKTHKVDEDGNPYTGRWKNAFWENGILLQVFSLKDAQKMRAIHGGEVVVFTEIPMQDIRAFAQKSFSPEKEEVTYQDKMKIMAEQDFDFLHYSGGKRTKEAIDKAYKVFQKLQTV